MNTLRCQLLISLTNTFNTCYPPLTSQAAAGESMVQNLVNKEQTISPKKAGIQDDRLSVAYLAGLEPATF
jgi:hypothetical protein